MNAQLPQIVNENVFPNGCSFWGLLFSGSLATRGSCFVGTWHAQHIRQWMWPTFGCLWVLQKLGNFTRCFVLLLMWRVLNIILSNKSLDAKRNAQCLENKMKSHKIQHGIFFLVWATLTWHKIKQINDKYPSLFHQAAITMIHTQDNSRTQQNLRKY